jgi:AraC family transcriptional activator of pobA
MPWPTPDAWNQHLEEMNKRRPSRALSVSLVRVERTFAPGWKHTAHVHPYWQMDLVDRCGFTLRLSDRKIDPKDGDIILIPPQNWHHFRRVSAPDATSGWSLKFSVLEMEGSRPPVIFPRGAASEMIHRALTDAAAGFCESGSSEWRIVTECLIAAALDICFSENQRESPENGLVRRARKMVDDAISSGGPVSVGGIASAEGCSTVYLNRIFKRSMGVPLKTYIDQRRFETARNLLLSSGLSVSETAAEMGFGDVFRFSRFFKRMSGESPRAFRRGV